MASLTQALPPPPTLPPDEAMVEHALRLLATAEVAEFVQSTRASERLAAWCERSALHRRACDEALRRWQALTGAATHLREEWTDPLTPTRTHRVVSPTRRRLLGGVLAGTGVAGLAGANAWWQWQARRPVFARAWRTRTAELLRVTLQDGAAGGVGAGTEITLSAQTALRAVLFRDRREVDLSEGEARFDVATDAARPFIVRTRAARVEVVGTAFTVADRGAVVTVAVERGRVRVLSAPGAASGGARMADRDPVAAAPPIELGPGDAISLRNGEPAGPARRVAPGDVGAWRSGWLVFDDTPLGDALPSINAFRRAPLLLADAATGHLRLTARFRAGDEHGLLAALPKVLPLRIDARSDGSVVVAEQR